VISRVTNDVEQMRGIVTGNVSKLISQVFQAAATLVVMVGLSWKLTLVSRSSFRRCWGCGRG
jgi:ABC-type multidrug transport system fused ATPase/permease subunit